MEINRNLGSKALQNFRRRHLSVSEMSQSHGFHFDLMYIFELAKRHYIRSAWKYAPNMKVSLESLHDLADIESGAERGGAKFYPKAQQLL